MRRAPAHAKLNLALIVGDLRPDGRHEVVTVLQRVALADSIALEPADSFSVDGYAEDTIVGSALRALAGEAGIAPAWRVEIEKRIPVASGLGGGSSDAAAALRLANDTLAPPLDPGPLHALAARLGADVPFFLTDGPQLGTADGTALQPVRLRDDYTVVLLLPHGAAKQSTASVYARFDEGRERPERFERDRAQLSTALEDGDLAAFPANRLVSSPLANELRVRGAFRADVTGAGPILYGLFDDEIDAAAAAESLQQFGRTWITKPAW